MTSRNARIRRALGALLLALSAIGTNASDLILTGVIDGPRPGGLPKAVELYVAADIADLSAYGIESANNGAAADGAEFTFPALPASAGTYLYVASESPGFEAFFGFAPDFTSFALSINGDDAVALYENDIIVDVYGELGVDGTGEVWDHLDGWAYRMDDTGPDGAVFPPGSWTFSGVNVLDGADTNGDAAVPFPIGTFTTAGGPVDPPATVSISEIRIDQPGADVDEYFELVGAPGADLSGLTYLVIGDGSGGSGVIESVTDLAGALDGDGFFLVAESAFTLGVADQTASLGFENSDNVTHLLVEGFSGASGDDLDADDDGLLDVLPWNAVLDAVSLVETPASGDAFYATTLGGQDVGPDGSFVPAHVCRVGSTFTIGLFDPADGDDSPGAANDGCGTPAGPEFLPVRIHEIQGSGPSVAITTPVEVQAVVTSVRESGDAVDGFFLQEEATDGDGDPATSEGIFVFCADDCPAGLAAGDLVTVRGQPGEFAAQSQIDARSGSIVLDLRGAGVPAAVAVALPADGPTDDAATFEAVESMVVRIPDTLFVSEYFELARFGSIVLTQGGRPQQYTNANPPGADGLAAYLDELARRRIVLDDADNSQNDAIFGAEDEPYAYPEGGFSIDNVFRGGDTITGLEGVMDWSFGAWRIRPVADYDYSFVRENPRSDVPADVGGRVKVASFNVLNYFGTLDTEDGPGCGPNTLGCRGADSAAELDRQTDKIVTALDAIDADVVGLIEIENDADDGSAARLVGALNAYGTAYDLVPTGFIGGDAIKVALLYDTTSVMPVGSPAILDDSVDPRFLVAFRNRPVLAQTFEEIATGARFTVAVAHLKSKGSGCGSEDPDTGDGQGNCNGTRTDAARAMVDWLATDPTGSGDPDVLVIGDLNAYAQEDPITVFRMNGYTDLVNLFEGAEAYSFVFDGQLGYLDHALAGSAIAGQVTGTTVWHVNADEVNVLDYDDAIRDPTEASFERKSDARPLFSVDPFRSSDHDPIVVGLDLAFPTPEVKDDCRKGGWETLRRDDGSSFRNQGQCIRFVNTGR